MKVKMRTYLISMVTITISHAFTNSTNRIVYMHRGASSAQQVAEDCSDDDSGSDQPLIRDLHLDDVAAQAPDELLESTTDHQHTDQDSTTPSEQHGIVALPPRRERERVYIIHRYCHNCMTLYCNNNV